MDRQAAELHAGASAPHGRVLIKSRWYADEPHSVPSPLGVIEVEVTEPSAPLHRRHCRALWHPTDAQPHDAGAARIGRWRKRVPDQSRHEEIARLCRRRWDADVDALAPAIGWNTVEPGNYGEHSGGAMDLHDRIDPKKARLKLKNKAAFKHFEHQLAASALRGFVGPIVDLIKLPHDAPQVVRMKQCRAERCRDQHGTCKRWADDNIQAGLNEAELAFRINHASYSGLSINKCRSLIADRGETAARPWQRNVPAKMFRVQGDWTITEFAYDPAPGELPAYSRPDRKKAFPRKNVSDDLIHTPRCVASVCLDTATSKFLRDHPDEMRRAVASLSRKICWHTWLALIQFRQFGMEALSVCRCEYCVRKCFVPQVTQTKEAHRG